MKGEFLWNRNWYFSLDHGLRVKLLGQSFSPSPDGDQPASNVFKNSSLSPRICVRQLLSGGLKARDMTSSTCFCHFDTLSSTTTTLLVWPLTSDTVSLVGSTNHSPSTTYLSTIVNEISNSQVPVSAHLYRWVPGPSCRVATHSPSSCCSRASGCQSLKLPATLNWL